MGIATDVKEITADIAASFESRMARVGEIQGEARGICLEADRLISGFARSRKRSGAQLRRDLAHDKDERRDLTADILTEADNILKGFGRARQKAASHLRLELADATETRRALAGELRDNARGMVKGMRQMRRQTGNTLRRDLSRNQAQLRSSVARIEAEFGKTRAGLRAELDEAHSAWREMAGAMQGRRQGAPVAAKAPVSDSDLPSRLLGVIKAHPQGVTLSRAAADIGVATVVLARASKHLLLKGQVRKKNKLYFPVTG
jgi:hypothetical protein